MGPLISTTGPPELPALMAVLLKVNTQQEDHDDGNSKKKKCHYGCRVKAFSIITHSKVIISFTLSQARLIPANFLGLPARLNVASQTLLILF
jgi:hypothetical protein